MNEMERKLIVDKALQILEWSFIEIRALSFEEGNSARINELADLMHNIPRFAMGLNDFENPERLRSCFAAYRARHSGKSPGARDFCWLLDMTDEEFTSHFRRTSWPWPAEVEEAVTV